MTLVKFNNRPVNKVFNSVFDENCQYVCAPTGGITGQGDLKCKDFAKNANLVKVIWKDERE